jgi:hypothetical protein
MIDLRISGVPVLDPDGRLVGTVTEGALLRRVGIGTEHRRARWSEPSFVQLTEARNTSDRTRSSAVFSIKETPTLDEIADLFETKGIKRERAAGRWQDCRRRQSRRALKGVSQQTAAPCYPSSVARRVARTEIDGYERKPGRSERPALGIIGSGDELTVLHIAAENIPGVHGIEEHSEFCVRSTGDVRPSPICCRYTQL